MSGDSTGRITLRGIEVFLATADERSVSAAAKRLGASPSSVSQQLSNLESVLGAALMVRNVRPVRLTPAGMILYRRAQVILDEAAHLRAELALADLSSIPRFSLGMIEDLEADVTPHLLSGLAQSLTGAQFRLETGASHALYDQLEARSLDMIVASRIGDPGDWAELHPVLQDGFVLVVPRGRIDQRDDIWAQLTELPFIQYTLRHAMGRQIAAHLALHDIRLTHQFEIDSYHSILALVGQGAGWSILTPLAWHRARRFADAVELLPLPIEPLHRTIVLMARRDILQDLPRRVVAQLCPILHNKVIAPAHAAYPFLGDLLRLL